MKRDRKRYPTILTEYGVTKLTEERERILSSTLPKVRSLISAAESRHSRDALELEKRHYLKRILWLNQHLNYCVVI